MVQTFGLILAGGGGRRLGGVDKARLRIVRGTLLHHVSARLCRHTDRLFVARARGAAACPDAFTVVTDRHDGPQGPSAGWYALVAATQHHAKDTRIVTAPVDAPFHPDDLLDRAVQALSAGAPCAVPRYGGRLYPTHAVWRLDALRAAMAPLSPAHAPALKSLLPRDTALVDFEEAFTENPFANVNTVRDLLALSPRLSPLHR